MKNTLVKLIIFFFLITYNTQSQELKVQYERTFTDTADYIYQTIILRVRDFPKNTNSCELINAFAIDESNKKIKPEYFLTQANREFWITFKKSKNFKKLIEIKGKAQFFTISKEEESFIVVDNILEKINKTIYSKNDIKIVVLDIGALKSKKEKNSLDYKNEISSIITANKLNRKLFENALKKSFENYSDLFDMILYCEDPKNEIENIDELFKTYNKWIGGIENESIKTFFFSKTDSTNMARISIKNPKTFQEIDFSQLISDKK